MSELLKACRTTVHSRATIATLALQAPSSACLMHPHVFTRLDVYAFTLQRHDHSGKYAPLMTYCQDMIREPNAYNFYGCVMLQVRLSMQAEDTLIP